MAETAYTDPRSSHKSETALNVAASTDTDNEYTVKLREQAGRAAAALRAGAARFEQLAEVEATDEVLRTGAKFWQEMLHREAVELESAMDGNGVQE